MLVLSTKPLQKLTGTGRQTDRQEDVQDYVLSQADALTKKDFLTLPMVSCGIEDSSVGKLLNISSQGHHYNIINYYVMIVMCQLYCLLFIIKYSSILRQTENNNVNSYRSIKNNRLTDS